MLKILENDIDIPRVSMYYIPRISMYQEIVMERINKGLMAGSTGLMIMHVLNEKDMYGYEIVKELEKRSQNVFSLKEGTLYPVLHGLEKEGLASSYTETSDTGKQRKYYKLTKKGISVLAQKKAEWKMFSKGVNTVIGDFEYAK
jgi:PadR family transcriptional regulator PadR